jgi:uncharacterized protein (TIGR02246 family)
MEMPKLWAMPLVAAAVLTTKMALGLFAAPPAAAPGPAPTPAPAQAAKTAAGAQDEAGVRAVVKNYVDARERGDATAVQALFTSDADQLTSSGEWRRGREAVVKGSMASSQRTGGTRTITVETVRFPAANVAIADGRYEIAALQGGEVRKMWASFVMTKGPDGWRIAAIRNMLPASAAPAAAPPAR